MFIGGIYNARTGYVAGIEQYMNSTVFSTIAELTILSASVSGMLYVFVATQPSVPGTAENSAVFLSRAISIIILLIYILWLIFRHRTHASLFYFDDQDGYVEPSNNTSGPKLGLWINNTVLIICMVLFCSISESVVRSLTTFSPTSGSLLAMYCLPIMLPLGRHIRALRLITRDKVDEALDLNIGLAVTIALFVFPNLVLLSWILQSNLSLRFDLFGTVAYGISALVASYVTQDGKTNYIEGIFLLGL